jgi:gluconolactonase
VSGTASRATPHLGALDPRTTAVILQDLQNDVVSEGGAFADTGASEHATRQDVVGNARRLADAAREAGATVIHVWHIIPDGSALVTAPLFEQAARKGVARRGTWGAAPAAGLEPRPGDYVLEKPRMNAFYGTSLDAILRARGTQTLVIAGAFTNLSVEHTARHAADAGYRALVPRDATSSMNEEWHDAALRYGLSQVATVATVDDVVAAWRACASRY